MWCMLATRKNTHAHTPAHKPRFPWELPCTEGDVQWVICCPSRFRGSVPSFRARTYLGICGRSMRGNTRNRSDGCHRDRQTNCWQSRTSLNPKILSPMTKTLNPQPYDLDPKTCTRSLAGGSPDQEASPQNALGGCPSSSPPGGGAVNMPGLRGADDPIAPCAEPPLRLEPRLHLHHIPPERRKSHSV
jgi:hypothetical protein